MEIFMTAGFLIFRYPLLRVLQTPEDTFTGTMSYITVILDILFMGQLHFGVQGAAVATIAAQAVSVILCLFYIIKNYPELHIKRDDLHVSPLLAVFCFCIVLLQTGPGFRQTLFRSYSNNSLNQSDHSEISTNVHTEGSVFLCTVRIRH